MFRHEGGQNQRLGEIVPSGCGATACTGRRGKFGDYHAPSIHLSESCRAGDCSRSGYEAQTLDEAFKTLRDNLDPPVDCMKAMYS